MAIDNTPPRLKLIITIGVITVVTLIGLDFVFRSYMAYMNDMAQREKSAPAAELEAQHVAEKGAFAKAKLPLDQAIAQVAKGVRDESIAPKPSDDTGAMLGWSKLPKHAPAAHAGTHDAPAVAGGDAGAAPAMAGDAGAAPTAADPHAAASDAGAGAHVEHGKVHVDAGRIDH